MKTSNIVILILIVAMMVMVLMAGCEEKAEEPYFIIAANTPIRIDPDTNDQLFITFHCEPVKEVALFDFNESVADPFTFSIDGVGKQFTHKEFKQRLGFIEPNDTVLEKENNH